MKNVSLFLLLIVSNFSIAQNQQSKLQSGPMLGYSEAAEALIWLQTKAPSSVYASYSLADDTSTFFYTDTLNSIKKNANTLKLKFTNLKAGSLYHYFIHVNEKIINPGKPFSFKTQPNWAYRTDPPAFSVAFGSCTYINEEAYDRPGKPYGGDYKIYTSIYEKKPDMMLWLGDNTYLRPNDWTSRSGYLHRYTHTRSLPELQALLASCNNFAIWDDHEYGANDRSGSWIHKDIALEVFQLFWANPSYGFKDLPGIMSSFTYMDADFILMDNRYNRTADFAKGEKHIFGKKQADYLIDMLKTSPAPFKFVLSGGQLLNTAKVYENHANYDKERAYILKRIEEENIKGVIFLTGDRHHSEVMELKLANGNTIYEFTSSPLTSSAGGSTDEPNDHRVEGSFVRERNFAIMNISGPFGKRVLELKYYDVDGNLLFEHTID